MTLFNSINGKTKTIALLGCPVEHTASPQLHNTLSRLLGINAVYVPLRVEKGCLGDAVKGLKACNFTGFNVTIPFKEEILKHVDELSDEVMTMGSANTIVNKDGRLYAYNTDGEGFAMAFEKNVGSSFRDRKVVILGAGGTARSLAVKLAARGVSKLYILNRTFEKAKEIADIINLERPGTAQALQHSSTDVSEDVRVLTDSDIIINTTSLGMHPEIHNSPLNGLRVFNSRQIICDVIYNPSRTKLLKQAEACGCKVMNGMGMLFYQGVLAYEKWMNLKVPDDIINKLSIEFMKYLDN